MSPSAKLWRARISRPDGVGPWVCVVAVTLGLVIAASTASAATESVLYSFKNNGADGMEPYAGVISVKGKLYGTTGYGGTGTCKHAPPYGCGTVFSVDAATGAETVIHSFQNDGEDGAGPNAGLIKVGKSLYGTTVVGGIYGGGTVFSIARTSGAETVLYSFCYSEFGHETDSCGPAAALINLNGIFYGTATSGGLYDAGTVYSFDPTTGKEAILHSFCGCVDDGWNPESVPINLNGILYGTTVNGGTFNRGTVFRLDPSNESESLLYSFCRKANCEDGDGPNGSLINVKGKLYGTTTFGGAFNYGTIYSLESTTGKERVLYSFQGGQDGAKPIGGAGLLKVGDMFYGTTGEGGGNSCSGYGCGTVFSFDRKTGTETVLHAFQDDGKDGNGPVAGVIDVNGTLYGTTVYGGKYGYGTVFEVVP